MALQFILGGSASGKSYTAYEKITREAAKNKGTEYLVIVPEQFTMQTQRDLVMMSEKKGISNIDVLSFMRLAYRVFEEVGMPDRLTLEDTGKNMIIRKLLVEKQNDLVFYTRSRNKQGFVEELKSLLTEFYQYSVNPEKVDALVEGLPSGTLLKSKLSDVNVIFKSFNEFKKDKYITAEEVLDILCIVLGSSGLIKNSIILFDGFTGFTPSQMKVIRLLLTMARDVIVTVTIDKNENLSASNEFELFALSKKTISSLVKLADEEHIPVAKHFYTEHVHDNAEIAALEKNIFRFPYRAYSGQVNSIYIQKEINPKSEAAFVMNEAEHLIRDLGYRYKDIAVISGDMDTYGEYIRREAEKRGILCFVDKKKDILENPLVELVRAALEVMAEDFSYEPVMRFLRCGFADLSDDDVDEFENFIIRTGLRGFKKYNTEWTGCNENVNSVRLAVVNSFEALREVFKDKEATASMKARAIYDFLLLHEAEEKIEKMRERFEAEGDLLAAKEYGQVYKLVLGVFEKMDALMGSEIISADEFSEIVESGFAEEDVGLIPPGLDCLVVGDLNRTRIKGIKALFVCGVNEGIIPQSGLKAGLLTDSDKEKIAGFDIELAPTLRERQVTEQFYLYMNLTKPSERLYLSYSLMGMDGAPRRASYLISKVKKVFPGLVERAPGEGEGLIDEVRRDGGLTLLTEGLTEDNINDDFYSLLKYYMENGGNKHFDAIMEGYSCKPREGSLSEAVSRDLFKDMQGSVSRLEKYAACAFAHFLSYGLGLNERKNSDIAAVDLGILFHDILARFSARAKELPEGFNSTDMSVYEKIAAEETARVIDGYNGGVFAETGRLKNRAEKIEEIAKVTAVKIVEQVQAGAFTPAEFEMKFDADGLKGTIDRMDLCNTDGAEYVRIVDYKSSENRFDISRFYYGLSIQLALYMNAVMKEEKKKHPEKEVVPAGMLYYHIQNPFRNEDESDDAFEKRFSLRGALNNDFECIKRMDAGFGADSLVPGYKSFVVKADTSSKGELKGELYPPSVMSAIEQGAERKARELIDGIKSGNIAVKPYKLGSEHPCEHCAYKNICGFETKTGRYSYNKMHTLSEEEINEIFGGKEE